jgi:CheY-like chemotaxis protein
MGGEQHHRKVLIIGEESYAREDMGVLLRSMGCQCVLASSVQIGLAALEEENPDAAIMDLHQTRTSAPQVVSALDKIGSSLRGRLLLITGERIDAQVSDLINRYSLPCVPRDRLFQELWGSLESLLRPSSLLRRVMQAARLVFDSFLQPSPDGIRILQPQLPARRLVYEAGGLMADLWIEPKTDSRRAALVGQLVDAAKPDRRLDRIPIVLRGQKGLIAFATTNEFGEFHFDFGFEPMLTLEMEPNGYQWVSVELPSLVQAAIRASAGS